MSSRESASRHIFSRTFNSMQTKNVSPQSKEKKQNGRRADHDKPRTLSSCGKENNTKVKRTWPKRRHPSNCTRDRQRVITAGPFLSVSTRAFLGRRDVQTQSKTGDDVSDLPFRSHNFHFALVRRVPLKKQGHFFQFNMPRSNSTAVVCFSRLVTRSRRASDFYWRRFFFHTPEWKAARNSRCTRKHLECYYNNPLLVFFIYLARCKRLS